MARHSSLNLWNSVRADEESVAYSLSCTENAHRIYIILAVMGSVKWQRSLEALSSPETA